MPPLGDNVQRARDVADELFARHASVFGDDLMVYRGHVHRVIGLVGPQADIDEELVGPLGLAAFFHDAGIWFDGTWDYLPPSIRRAQVELSAWDPDPRQAELVAALIGEHHRLRRARHPHPLVEAFRRADLTDVTDGLVPPPRVPRSVYRELVAAYPARGLRPMLLRAFARGVRERPLRPLPMVKL